jgi:broad specificity phosphatase PhoE
MLTALLLLAALDAAPAKTGPLATLGPIPKGAVRLFLVRHGQALSNLNPRPKLPLEKLDHLTNLGRSQTERMAALLGSQGVRHVLSSPAGRAQETATIFQQAFATGAAPLEPRLRPLEMGRSAAGQPLGWDEREAEWKAGRDPQPAGGEALRQVADRVIQLSAALARERAGQAVVLVSHGEVIAAVVGALRGLPVAEWEELSLGNGSVTVVEAAPGKPAKLGLVNVPAEVPKP